MKRLLNFRSLIRVTVIMLVMAFLTGQVTETYAEKKGCKQGYHKLNKKGKCKRCKKIIKVIINNNDTSGGDQTGDCDVCEELTQIREAIEAGGGVGNRDGGGFPCQDGGTPVGDRWIVSDSGLVVCDKNTGYSWQQRPLSIKRTWQEAMDYCPTLGDGWTLPKVSTLETLVDTSNSNPALPSGHPFSNVQSSDYWPSDTSAVNSDFAWRINFFLGNKFDLGPKASSWFVWCVRGVP